MSVVEENWVYQMNIDEIEKNSFENFEKELNIIFENIPKVLEDNFIIETVNPQINAQTFEEKLRFLSEGNKELKQQIELKLKELSDRQTKYENYKQDYKLLTQEIKETHEAFLMAKKYYKKFLNIYFSIEKRFGDTQVIFVQFFTESKKDNENYSIRLLRHTTTGQYELQSVQPKLKLFKELQKELLQTNDVPGVLCCVRQAFLELRENKN